MRLLFVVLALALLLLADRALPTNCVLTGTCVIGPVSP
jgi:hypothetical protein